jgi:hypothetical protein
MRITKRLLLGILYRSLFHGLYIRHGSGLMKMRSQGKRHNNLAWRKEVLMKTQEVLDKLKIAQADVEWSYDIGIAAALDVAIKRVKDWERLKAEIKEYKSGIEPNSASEIWIICALSNIEGCMAEMENEE